MKIVNGPDFGLKHQLGAIEARTQCRENDAILYCIPEPGSRYQGILFGMDTNAFVISPLAFAPSMQLVKPSGVPL